MKLKMLDREPICLILLFCQIFKLGILITRAKPKFSSQEPHLKELLMEAHRNVCNVQKEQ